MICLTFYLGNNPTYMSYQGQWFEMEVRNIELGVLITHHPTKQTVLYL